MTLRCFLIIILLEVYMKYAYNIVVICAAFVSGAAQNAWVETSQADFCDGTYERNLYASNRDGGTVEFAPRFDLNNDGYIDLFTADAFGPYVKIYWGDGFGASTLFPTSGADNCDAADLDNDGYPDFVVSHLRSASKISIYWGGIGGPSSSNYFDINTISSTRQGVFIADFNKDGYLDIATGQQFISGSAAVLWGSASGFNGANRTDLPLDFSVHNIEAADFNKDGWLDILFTNYLNPDNIIYWGSSSGFSPSNLTQLENLYGSHGISVADLGKDGYLDLIFTAWNSSESYIYWGSATGYSNVNKQILNTGNSWGGSSVAHMNSDEYLDIVFHRGGGGSHQQEIFWGSATGYSVNDTSNVGTPIEATGGLVADLNYDGHLDIFCNAYTPGTQSPISWGPGFATWTGLAVNDDHHGMFREIGNVYDRHYHEDYTSSVFDAGQVANWGTVTWEDSLPSGTSIAFYVRSGDTPGYDPTWSGWCLVNNGSPVPDSLNSRYIQYLVMFSYTNPACLPCLYEVSIAYLTEGIAVITPNGGESWIRATAYDITWSSSGVSGNVKIELYKGGSFSSVITSSTANVGSYTWNIPSGQLPGVDYTIRISSLDNPAFFDFSNGDFSISSQIVLIAPNGGEIWYVGENYDVTWAPSGIGGGVMFQYSIDGGSNWLEVIPSTPDDGSYSWALPSTPTTHARAKISHLTCTENIDSSDADFIITYDSVMVLYPNGGEYLLRGDSCTITWISSGIGDSANIELYKSGNYNSTIAGSVPNTGVYVWYIPSSLIPGDDYQIRISSVVNPSFFDLSDSCFAVFSQLTVTAPNGGEVWYVGESRDITWAPSGIGGDVFMEYSTNSGSTWLVLTVATPDDGSHSWTIPNTTTTNGRVKITHLTCTNNIDESDADFTITYSGVEELSNALGVPSVFYLDQNHPNPFNKLTAIKYGIPKPCRVHIGVYDVLGKRLATLLDDALAPGYYQTIIDIDDFAGSALPNGVYFYRMVADDYLETRMMTVLR